MHPLIKLVSLLIMIIMVVQFDITRILVITGLSFMLLLTGQHYWRAATRMIWRMKWLWLSLIVLYGWFIPGEPVINIDEPWHSYLPTVQGIEMAIPRILALVAIVITVVIVMQSSRRDEMVSALIILLRPVSWLGIDTSRFALRMVMTIDMVTRSEQCIYEELHDEKQRQQSANVVTMVSKLLMAIEREADIETSDNTVLTTLSPVQWFEWLIPVCLFLILFNLT